MDFFNYYEKSELVKNFINSMDNNLSRYFDSEEMEMIIEELMGSFNFQYLSLAIEHAIAQFPYEAIFRFYRVKKLALEYKIESAEKELNEIEKTFPPSADLYVEKALLSNLTNKKTEYSIKWLHKALALEPNDPDIHFLIGHEYIRNNDILTAIKHVLIAIENDPIFGENLFSYSFLFEELDKPVEAVEFFTILTEELPLLGAAWFGLGYILSWTYQYKEAIDAYNFAITCDGEFAAAHFNMANAFFELKDYDMALHHYFEAYSFDKEDFQSLTNIGDCYAVQKWFDEALEYYYKSYHINPIHNETVLGIVNALGELGKIEDARAFVVNAFEKNPQNIELLFSVVVFFTAEEDADFFFQLSRLTLNHLENVDNFFFFVTHYCILNELCEVGVHVMDEFLFSEYIKDDIMRSKLYYYMAACCFLNQEIEKGSDCLKDALLMNPDWHKNFMELSPLLETYPEILKLLELYV